MADYLIQDGTLKGIGNSIRNLNETTSIMTPDQMINNIDDAVDEIESQTVLIAQCLSALEGKIAGGGSSGSGGGAVETYSFSLNYGIYDPSIMNTIDTLILYHDYENGEIVAKTLAKDDLINTTTGITSHTIQVVKNTYITVMHKTCYDWFISLPPYKGDTVGLLYSGDTGCCILASDEYGLIPTEARLIEIGIYGVL